MGRPHADLELQVRVDALEHLRQRAAGLGEVVFGKKFLAKVASGVSLEETPVAADAAPKEPELVKPVKPAGAHSIDGFIAAKLNEKGWKMHPEADRVSLLRRALFGLTGLPPTPAEVLCAKAGATAPAATTPRGSLEIRRPRD